MTAAVIIDIVVALILVFFTVNGVKRGLPQSAAGLVILVAALIGASLITSALTEPVTQAVSPLLTKQVTRQVDEAMAQQTVEMPEEDTEDPDGIEALLALIGLDSDVRESLTEQVQDTVRDTGVSIATAVVESMTRTIVSSLLFLVSFVLLVLLLRMLLKAMDLVARLPGLHLFNSLGGGAVGLIQGALVLFLAVWILRRLGMSFETGAFAGTHLLKFFTANTPLGVLSFLS